MDPLRVIELKHLIRDKLLEEALQEVSKINLDAFKRVRIIFEFEDRQGIWKDSVEIRERRPWD